MSVKSATVRLKGNRFPLPKGWQRIATTSQKSQSVAASAAALPSSANESRHKAECNTRPNVRPLQRLPLHMLLRNIVLGQIFKSPVLFKPSLWLLERIANSRSAFLNADKNPIIKALVLPLVYKQFCAGRTIPEVRKTIVDVKSIGYSGIILNYAGEIVVRTDLVDGSRKNASVNESDGDAVSRAKIAAWKDAQIASLDAVNEGDYIGVKYTGAGESVCQALKEKAPPCTSMLAAMYAVCDHAQTHKKRLWIDAEQQVYHPGIDNWTISLMRKYNKQTSHGPRQALVLTTVQAYLKTARETTERYLSLASQEGWVLGLKLVRGAYIGSDVRSNIHDTKADTDACYDSIAHDLIVRKKWSSATGTGRVFPEVDLFLAGHNTQSIHNAAALLVQQQKSIGGGDESGGSTVVNFGQLQGMADDVGCDLLTLRDEMTTTQFKSSRAEENPLRVYKCLPWGSVHECLHYLVRRAVENRGAAERVGQGLKEMKKELRLRLLGLL